MNALLIIDIQNDFTPATGATGSAPPKPDGALAVPDGNAVVPMVNRLMGRFGLVVATQDWHPPDHGSFASQHPGHDVGDTIDLEGLPQILWPDHCVQHTTGAEFVAAIDHLRIQHVARKGTDRHVDSYSGFFDNGQRNATGLGDHLKQKGIRNVYLLGLATDYCVKFTALDAVQLGFRCHLIEDGCRGMNLKAGDVDEALRQMRNGGVRVIRSADLPDA